MLVVPPPRYPRKHGRVIEPVASPTPVLPLTLVSAAYEPGGTELTLTFDRAIDIAGIDVSAFVVNDGIVGFTYQGIGSPTQLSANAVLVLLEGLIEFEGPDARLTVGAGNGIVASGDGAAWAGVSDVVVPFG